MKLENSLFTILTERNNDTEVEFNLSLEKNHFIYKAHFPGHPVTPGVIQLQIITELCNKYSGKQLAVKTIEKCKFLKAIDPNDQKKISVSINLKEEEGEEEVLTVIVSIHDESTTFTKASLFFHTQHPS